MTFKKAIKEKLFVRLAITGPSGSGKTKTALRAAYTFGSKVAAVDTECRSMSLYADEFDFDVKDFDSYNPQSLIDTIKEAEESGYEVLIIDSLSHFWMGKDGFLEQVDKVTARSNSNNKFTSGWREMSPVHNQLVEAILGAQLHIICAARSKTAYIMEESESNNRKRTVPKKIGMAPQLRDGMEYEFTAVIDMDIDHRAIVTKSRCSEIADEVVLKPGPDFFIKLSNWISGGISVVEEIEKLIGEDVSTLTAEDWTSLNEQCQKSGYFTQEGLEAFQEKYRAWQLLEREKQVREKIENIVKPFSTIDEYAEAFRNLIKEKWFGDKANKIFMGLQDEFKASQKEAA